MEKLLEAQQQQLDDITSESSFLEFLRNEQNCLLAASVVTSGCNGAGGGAGCGQQQQQQQQDQDVDSILEQVSRLAGLDGTNDDHRTVDEILREAERLMRKQPVFVGGGDNGEEVLGPWCVDFVRDISCESTPMEMKENGMLEELEAIGRREEESRLALAKMI